MGSVCVFRRIYVVCMGLVMAFYVARIVSFCSPPPPMLLM